jgi:hypothetical protein
VTTRPDIGRRSVESGLSGGRPHAAASHLFWAALGRRSPGLLAPVYGWFTKGFDTADLKGAKALLDGLA